MVHKSLKIRLLNFTDIVFLMWSLIKNLLLSIFNHNNSLESKFENGCECVGKGANEGN